MASTQWVDWSKTTRSKDYRGSNSFATFMIIGPVCFFLGILFACFPYDFPLLWTSDPVPPAYYDQLEVHLRFLHQSPPLIARLLSMVISVGFLGFFVKLFRPSEANVLFDGASLVLYLIGTGIYLANIVHGLRSVSAGAWIGGAGEAAALAAAKATASGAGPAPGDGSSSSSSGGGGGGGILLGREDSLKVLAASNTILALVLVGVLILQAGQWYAERREAEDDAQTKAAAASPKPPHSPQHAGSGATSTKKKQ
ncbi:secretory component protein [Niveomyces insectorum RCEF 264]|uniref:Secretory component protein n=1 Tax=Niveomyces insectorum RCEF 264 TaxID=1081102 RepID=A0A168ADZ7_9HYPO|nr:secretory component protein [Niveomyces insectorum RCEF 264]